MIYREPFKMLKMLGIRTDRRLFISIVPFIAFAGVTRTLRDYVYFSSTGKEAFFSGFYAHMQIIQEEAHDYILGATGNPMLAWLDSHIIAWFPTPGSYVITFSLALISLFFSLLVQKYLWIAYWKTLTGIGLALFITTAALLPVNNVLPLLYIAPVSILWTLLFFSVSEISGRDVIKRINRKVANSIGKILTRTNSAILSAHFFDATATFFAIAVFSTMAGQGYTEQHFLSRSLMPFLGPQVMFLMKFIVVVPVLYFIDRYMEDKEFGNFLKLVVLILGLAPASRNLARLMVGV